MEPKEQNPDQMTEVVLQPTQPKLVSFVAFLPFLKFTLKFL